VEGIEQLEVVAVVKETVLLSICKVIIRVNFQYLVMDTSPGIR
jgi:hypothetical protein